MSTKIEPQTQRLLRSLRLPKRETEAFEAWASTFYPFQQRWLFSTAGLAISNKSRQIGLSHTTSGVGVFWGAALGELTTIISIGDRESIEVLDKARKHAEMLRRLGSQMAEPGPRDKASEITFASGGRILALPASGGRGYTGNLFLDEFAYHGDYAKQVWDNAVAVTMHKGFKLRVASTPNGIGNTFHGLWRRAKRGNGGWEAHEIPIELAEAEGFPVDHDKCWEYAKGDPRLFDQLFRCSFLDNSLQYVPSELIEAATTTEPPPHAGECYAGLDIGRTANLTALVVVRVVDGVSWVVALETRQRTSLEDLDALVDLAIRTFGVRRLCVDATGMGAFPAESMQRRYGRQRVEPVTFTPQVKEDLATTLYQAFADQRLKLRRPDAELREDIASIRRLVTSAGNVRYDAPNTDEGHADRAWALALALHAAAKPSGRRVEILDYHEHE